MQDIIIKFRYFLGHYDNMLNSIIGAKYALMSIIYSNLTILYKLSKVCTKS